MVESGSVYLAYGGFAPIDLVELVGKEILPILTRHDLRPEWDGNVNTRIRVDNAQWFCEV